MTVLLPVLTLIAASAQQYVEPGIPVTGELVDAGVFNWTTKSWVQPDRVARLRAASLTVYNNTCTYTSGNNYDGIGLCTTFFDEGRIPSTSDPLAPPAASDDNLISSFEIAYCTRNANGTIDLKVGFYNNWGGCMSGMAGTPWTGTLSSVATAYFDFGAAAGFPLPGDPVPGGSYQCNKVTIALGNSAFCLASDGEGFYDNQVQLDVFAWSVESNTPASGSAPGINLIRAGEPSLSPRGGCTYNIPCGSDPTPWTQFGPTPQNCGHGLDTEDHWWMNVDNEPWGGGQTGSTCTTAPTGGSGCYWFGGNPGNPFASYWLVLGSAGSCSGCNGLPLPYCTSGTSTSGCNATMTMTGVPSAANTGVCNITATNVDGQKTGLIFYGMTQVAVQWGTSSSFLCVKAPTQRTPASNSGGNAGQCNGTISTDINAFFAANPGALGQPLSAGQVLNFQCWYRDPPSPKTTNLSNGLSITMCP